MTLPAITEARQPTHATAEHVTDSGAVGCLPVERHYPLYRHALSSCPPLSAVGTEIGARGCSRNRDPAVRTLALLTIPGAKLGANGIR